MTETPLISVIIPTHNRASLLSRAIDSVLEQTWDNIEIVVVDDASDDKTPDLLGELMEKYSHIRIIKNDASKGAAVCRNIAIKHSKGEYITGLDDDDYWRPTRMERLMKEFEEGFSAICSYDRMVMDDREAVWKKPTMITLDDLLYYNRVGNQVLTKKEYLEKVGGYDEELPSAQDYDLWIRLVLEFGPIRTVTQALQVVNMEEDRERITTSDKKMEGYLQCFQKHEKWMSRKHKKYQKYRLKMAAGEHVSWIDLLRSVPPGLYVKEITRKLFL
ncbi:glycosyltransferase [Rhodohalobacter sp. 8-1]|uniref:glycosyltransferase n=1 Tax=Rhodohalobacter sp. 8-1 TaxID=3131972 RepID=UPI0030EF9326